QGVPPQQLLSALFNLPVGEDGNDPMSMLSKIFGAGAPAGAGQGGAGAMSGMLAGPMQAMFQQILSELEKYVREVHLTVTWKEGKSVETIDLVTHVVSLGPGS